MAEPLIPPEQWQLLFDHLVTTFGSVNEFKEWLDARLPDARKWLGGGNLEMELTHVYTEANAVDGAEELLRTLVSHPPHEDPELAWIIYAITNGRIRKASVDDMGLSMVAPHQNYFAVRRPFVNRRKLREHLANLDNRSAGAECILVIDGKSRTGKSFSLYLARGCKGADELLATIDIDEFAQYASPVDAATLARLIAGEDDGFPAYDRTKESEALPRLNLWLVNKLRKREKPAWVIVDHCNRPVLSREALQLLVLLATRIRVGDLPNLRLILVDFDRGQLPEEWRDDIRHDEAVLPDEASVKEWCNGLAIAARRRHSEKDAEAFARRVFMKLADKRREDGSWHKELEGQLKAAYESIMKSEEAP